MRAFNVASALVIAVLAVVVIVLIAIREAPLLSLPTLPAAALSPISGGTVTDEEEPAERTCDAPIVYNKPAKTGSTSIQSAMISWANSSSRHAIRCSPYIAKASMQLRECIPYDPTRCAVLATHVELDRSTRELLTHRLGGRFILLTSTRDPLQRIVSLYMQMRRIQADQAQKNLSDIEDFTRGLNPWDLYNYHTGEARTGTCPMEEVEKRLLVNLVKHVDIVLDIDLLDQSNKILKSHDLFQLSSKRSNVRGSWKLVLNNSVKEAIKSVSCVEDEMHRLFRLRMASLYGRATGKPCLTEQRHPTTCF